jgi:hypothetical protein
LLPCDKIRNLHPIGFATCHAYARARERQGISDNSDTRTA